MTHGGPWQRRGVGLTRFAVVVLTLATLTGTGFGHHLNDLNQDGLVDLADVVLFSEQELSQDYRLVDWCEWVASAGNKYEKHAGTLLAFIVQAYACDPLTVVQANLSPTRLAWAPEDRLVVTDPKVGSVFIYARYPELTLVGELKHLETPLGVAVDAAGNFYVGSQGRHQIEVYDAQGALQKQFGHGEIQMPNALAFDQAGLLYVADSKAARVFVYDPLAGTLLRTIGIGQLSFPVGLAISATELFVADSTTALIQVFDLHGTWLRTLGGPIYGSFSFKWMGRFVRLQSIALDGAGRLHAADSHMGLIQILNSATGAFITSYGSEGSGPGQLRLPQGIAIRNQETAVADNLNRRIELLVLP